MCISKVSVIPALHDWSCTGLITVGVITKLERVLKQLLFTVSTTDEACVLSYCIIKMCGYIFRTITWLSSGLMNNIKFVITIVNIT